jgi:hypothetical protein
MTEEKKIKVVATLRWEGRDLLLSIGKHKQYAGYVWVSWDGTFEAVIPAWTKQQNSRNHATKAEAMAAVEEAVVAALGGEVVE